MVKTIAIRNPNTINVVADEFQTHGTGRDMTETAEGLIADGKAARDAKRVSSQANQSVQVEQESTAA